MEGIQLMYLHDIKVSLDLVHSKEMTSLIEMKSAIAETRSIIDGSARHGPFHALYRRLSEDLDRKHLLDGLDCIIEASERRCLDFHALSCHIESICLFCDLRIQYKDKSFLRNTLYKSAFL